MIASLDDVSRRLRTFGMQVAVKGAGVSMRVPVLRDYLLDVLISRLGTGYDRTVNDPDQLAHCRWFGSHLEAFLHRLVNERPAAAQAIMRFIGTWVVDMYRRQDREEAGAVAPCTAVVEPTDRCNLNCPGCYAHSTTEGSDLSYEQLVSIIDQLVDMGVTLITFSGGEPFLREKIDQSITRLARKYSRRGFLIYTNGTLIDPETARRLGRAGNVFPAISVEGFEHQTDSRRGRGVYEQNRRARRNLAANGVMAGFSATCTRENVESICTDDFIDLRIAEGDLFGWFFLLQPIGRSPRPDLMVTADQRALLRDTILRWRRQNRPIFLGDFWNDAPMTGGCIAAARYYFHIYANGDISPCVFAPIASGNIFDIISGKSPYRSLKDFVQDNPVFVAFRQEQEKVKDRARPCLMIDHPQAYRRIRQVETCYPGKNMADGYTDGEIAKHLDQVSAQWLHASKNLTPMMESSEGAVVRERSEQPR